MTPVNAGLAVAAGNWSRLLLLSFFPNTVSFAVPCEVLECVRGIQTHGELCSLWRKVSLPTSDCMCGDTVDGHIPAPKKALC